MFEIRFFVSEIYNETHLLFARPIPPQCNEQTKRVTERIGAQRATGTTSGEPEQYAARRRGEQNMLIEDITEEEMQEGREILRSLVDRSAAIPKPDPLRYADMTQNGLNAAARIRYWLEALVLRNDGDTWRVFQVDGRFSLPHDISPEDGEPPLRDRESAIRHAFRHFLPVMLVPTISEIASAMARKGTFRLRRRGGPDPEQLTFEFNMENDMDDNTGFYNQSEEELLSFHNHHDLVQMFGEEPSVRIEPSSDYYVTRPMVWNVLRRIEEDMIVRGQPMPELSEKIPRSFEDFASEVPEGFFDGEPDDWDAALPYYRVILTRLLALVRAEGVLICAWDC